MTALPFNIPRRPKMLPMERQDYPATAVVAHALKYLAEKYPGLATFCSSGNPCTLGINIQACKDTHLIFISRLRKRLFPAGFSTWQSLRGEDLRLILNHEDPNMFDSSNTYIKAFEERYPGKSISLETHTPVVEALVGRKQVWTVVGSGHPYHPKKVKRYDQFASGWGNGYVGVCSVHPWFKRDYSEYYALNIEVHGGVTYSSAAHPEEDEDHPDDLWWMGFDTGHWDDAIDNWPKERIKREAQYLYLQAAWAFAGIDKPIKNSSPF